MSDSPQNEFTLAPCATCEAETRLWRGVGNCDACSAEIEKAYQREQRMEALRDRARSAVFGGAIERATLNVSFGTADAPPACNAATWAACRKWTGEKNVVFWGPTGVGKSHLARCMMTAAFRNDRDIAETNARRVVKIAARFDEGRGLFDLWRRADILLLDDIDKATWTEDALTALWELLDDRAKKRTLITSNIPWANLPEFMLRKARENSSLVYAALDRLKPVDVYEMKGTSLR